MDAHFQKWLKKLPRRYKKYRQPPGLWSMTIPRELAFCESYARECFSGAGRMVDLGCWLGATTFSLARGLTRNPRAQNNRHIDALDLFIWTTAMDAVAEKIGMPPKYRTGESFYEEVRKLIEPYKEIVRLHQEDLLEYEPAPEPVEFLFIDAFKTWPLAQKVVREFFPLLISDVSIVVQQDFIFHHPIAATSHLVMWRLRDHFQWLHQIPRSGSVVFLCKKQIEPAAFLSRLEPESFTLEEIDAAYDYSRACVVEDDRRVHIEATKLLFLIERGRYDAALKHAQWLVEKRIKFPKHVLADAQSLVAHTQATLVGQKGSPNEFGSGDRASEAEQLRQIDALLASL
jgi:hypothetical protein